METLIEEHYDKAIRDASMSHFDTTWWRCIYQVKPLPSGVEYTFLGDDETCSTVISSSPHPSSKRMIQEKCSIWSVRKVKECCPLASTISSPPYLTRLSTNSLCISGFVSPKLVAWTFYFSYTEFNLFISLLTIPLRFLGKVICLFVCFVFSGSSSSDLMKVGNSMTLPLEEHPK